MLSWHQNKINEIQSLVKKYNARVVEVTAKDAPLIKQAELIDGKLDEYGAKPKAFKSEIAELKKQNKIIEKQRKTLANQMEDGSNELADYLKQSLAESQDAIGQRLEDIIQNMTYMFQEQLSY
jgi:DNA repair ATPase RecN